MHDSIIMLDLIVCLFVLCNYTWGGEDSWGGDFLASRVGSGS